MGPATPIPPRRQHEHEHVRGRSTVRKQIEQLVKVVEGAEALDPALEKVAALVNAVTGPRLVKNGLSGSWLGHPVHPLLVAIPIGAWTSASAIDVLGGDGSDEAGT
ncbi:MAG: hypothetical protein QOG64_862, partial [Acidimicrobiaceae bacterium]|nr:hypothetical protein [Acidimicrobiaceae bacterium]